MKLSGHGQIEHTQLIGSTDRSVGQSSDRGSQEKGGTKGLYTWYLMGCGCGIRSEVMSDV